MSADSSPQPPARQSRARKPKVRLRLQVGYNFRWEPDLDFVTGEGGTGLWKAARLWWQLRTGRWVDDDLPVWGDYPVLSDRDPISDPQPDDPAYCEACGGACRDES